MKTTAHGTTSESTFAELDRRHLVGCVSVESSLQRLARGVRRDGLVMFDGVGDGAAMLALAERVMTVVGHPDSDEHGITTVTDLGRAAAQPNAGGFSRRGLTAHTDRSGVAAPPTLLMMCCALQAPSGGASRFVDGLAMRGLGRQLPSGFACSCQGAHCPVRRCVGIRRGGPDP